MSVTDDYLRRSGNSLSLRLTGAWKAGQIPLAMEVVAEKLALSPGVEELSFDSEALGEWDSGLLAFLLALNRLCQEQGVRLCVAGLPPGVQRIMALTTTAAAPVVTEAAAVRDSFLPKLGGLVLRLWGRGVEMIAFLGEVTEAFGRLLAGKGHLRFRDLTATMQACGVASLPIVALISFLVGVIFAFVGAMQLKMFGAQIFVASLVGISIVRIMGAIMTGIVIAGRTGSAFAAQLGTMQVNEEIDALTTFGINPVDFLVLPRLLALFVMMPLLCLYADFMGLLGGLTIGVLVFDLNILEYLRLTGEAVRLQDFAVGLFHSAVFGVIVALSGCLSGMQCGRSAAAVGEAATKAVVSGIISIIVATAVITVACNIIGI
jgi:phospholipid/cholesterol/gamma-HCH transport system permease protein